MTVAGLFAIINRDNRDNTMKRDEHRIFRGSQTNQRDYNGNRARADYWYYEPCDYDGYTLWSGAYATEEDARVAADSEFLPEYISY